LTPRDCKGADPRYRRPITRKGLSRRRGRLVGRIIGVLVERWVSAPPPPTKNKPLNHTQIYSSSNDENCLRDNRNRLSNKQNDVLDADSVLAHLRFRERFTRPTRPRIHGRPPVPSIRQGHTHRGDHASSTRRRPAWMGAIHRDVELLGLAIPAHAA